MWTQTYEECDGLFCSGEHIEWWEQNNPYVEDGSSKPIILNFDHFTEFKDRKTGAWMYKVLTPRTEDRKTEEGYIPGEHDLNVDFVNSEAELKSLLEELECGGVHYRYYDRAGKEVNLDKPEEIPIAKLSLLPSLPPLPMLPSLKS